MMYLDFFGLQAKPFHTTPDPYFLYLSSSHKQALGSIIYGVKEKKGFIAVTGEVGLGKTTILRSFLAQDHANQQTIYLLNPNLSFASVLKTLLRELGCNPIEGDDAEVVEQLHMVLIDAYHQNTTVVLLIDDAQNMPVTTLENLRMLSNLETSKDKLIQIVLVGQPELDALLDRYELRQIRQRIALRAMIRPLSQVESFQYIRHRLDMAGGEGKNIFTNGALKRIVREAKGIPRKLNILSDNALVTALGYNKKMVTAHIATEVINDLSGRTTQTLWKLIPLAAGALILVLALVALMPLADSNFSNTAPLQEIEHLIDQGVKQSPSTLDIAKVSNQSNQEDVQFAESDTSVPEELEEIAVDTTDLFPIQPDAENLDKISPQREKNVSKNPSEQSKQETKPQVVPDKNIPLLPNVEDHTQLTVQMAKNVSGNQAELSTAEGIYQVFSDNKNTPVPHTDNRKQSTVLPAQPVSEKPHERPREEAVPEVRPVINTEKSLAFPNKTPKSHSSASPLTRIMKKGETLAGLMQKVYGSSNPETLRFVLKHNRHIVNVRKIYPGQQIVFPPLTKTADQEIHGDEPRVLVSHTGEGLSSSKQIFTESSVPTKLNQEKVKAKRRQPYAVAIVQEGDTLEKLANVVYGSSDPIYIQQILDYNPQIVNPKKIFPGQNITFPRKVEEVRVLAH